MILGGALFVWTNGACAWISARLARRLLPQGDIATRLLAGCILFVGLTLLSQQALGVFGLLAPVPLAALLAVLALVTARRAPAPRPAEATPGTTLPDPLARLAWVLAGAVCVGSVAVALSGHMLYGWDTLSYHGVSPAWWIQQADLSPPPYNYEAYFPMNVELHSLWFMLPFGHDAHANLGSLSWIAILVAAFAVHAAILRQYPWLAASVLCVGVLSPKIHGRLPYLTSVDLALAASLLAMLAFAWVPGSQRRATARALLSGLAGGLAMGMKPTAAPLLALVGLFWIWRGARLDGGRRHVGWFLIGTLLLGAPWYMRNLLLSGNPFFPAAFGPFDGPFTAEAQRATSLVPKLAAAWDKPGRLIWLARRMLDWPVWLGLTAAVGYLAGVWALLRTRDRLRRAHISLMLLAGLGFLVLFPLAPFSGSTNRPDTSTVYYVRYITFWFLSGLVLLPSLLPPRRATSRSASRQTPLPRAALPLLLLVSLVALAASTPARLDGATRNLTGPMWRQLGPAWSALEQLPDGSRVAVYERDPPSHALIYPLFGRRLQYEPVAINLDGTPRRPLHETWRDEPRDWWWEFSARKTLQPTQTILRNLREAGVEFLLLADWPVEPDAQGPRPRHPRWEMPQLLDKKRLLFNDMYAALWDIRTGKAPR